MKEIKDFCVSSNANGFDEFLKVLKEYFKLHLSGRTQKYYGVEDGIFSMWSSIPNVIEVAPQEAIALLTGKQLTEGDLIVGNRFECIETFHDGRINFVKGDIYPCNRNSGISDHRGYNIQVSMDMLNRHFIRAIKEEKMEILKQTDIAEVCEQVINATPSVWINSNGADETTCPFCHAKIYEAVGDIGELPHNNNCAYLIAKDLKTRYNGNTK